MNPKHHNQPAAKVKVSSKSNKTLVGFLLDETGSMMSISQATVSGFNEYIQTLKNKGNAVDFSLARFNSLKFVNDPVRPIADVPELKDYAPNNGTPLYDSIAKLVKQLENEKTTKDTKVLMVIMTDGEENESKEFDRKKIMELIKGKEKAGWTFTYLGANQDSWAVGGQMGMSTGNSVNFAATSQGIKTAFMAASNMTAFVAQNVERGTSFDSAKLFNAQNVDQLVNDQELDPNALPK